jgi:hypothetical protein
MQPDYWLKKFNMEGRWLQGSKIDTLESLDNLFELAKGEIKEAIIWDTDVPATINVATTMAGIENGVVFSPGFAQKYVGKWKIPVIKDLKGMFTGKLSGSAKNDAYRWAIDNYLSKGLCYRHRLFLLHDSFAARQKGDLGYVVTRDWAVQKGSFVYDLSPWGDEVPLDDPNQKPGTDLETYRMILTENFRQTAGKEMTEISGFFEFPKYTNMPDHKSFHEAVPTEWESVFVMTPYNCYQNTVSSYCFNQSFHSQAPTFNFKQLDLTISPMVLDWDEPSQVVKDAYAEFSPDGFATIVYDFHNKGGKNPKPQVWKGMPVMELHNEACNFTSVKQTAKTMSGAISVTPKSKPAFHFFRIVWTSPSNVIASIDELKKIRPELNIEVLDPYNFNLFWVNSPAARGVFCFCFLGLILRPLAAG